MIRKVIMVVGLCTVIVSGILFVLRQERSAAYFILSQQRKPPAFLSQQLRLPDGRVYRHLSPDFGDFAAWSPDIDAIFHQRADDGLYIYDIHQRTDHLVVKIDAQAGAIDAQTGVSFAPNTFPPDIFLSPDGTGYLFVTETSVYHFDTHGDNVREIFTSPTNGVYAMWEEDGRWAIVSYVDADFVRQFQRINVRNPSWKEAPRLNFQFSTPFGLIEPNLPVWRIYPHDSEESIELQFPEGTFYISEWLADDLLLVAEQIEFSTLRNLYLMNIHTQELTEVAHPDDVGTAMESTLKGDNLYLYYAKQPGFALYEIPMDGGAPRLIIRNCTDVFFFDSKAQRTRRWAGEPVDTIFIVVNDEGGRSLYRYDFGEYRAQLLYSTPGLASQSNIYLGPDQRLLFMSYEGIGTGPGYRHHLMTVDINDGSATEIAQDQSINAVSPLIDRAVNVEVLVMAGILLSGIGLYRKR
ncbi:MAG: hypothetical protein L0154_14845 [Chloroflexi bacterium]|nr:hypothetical protein [Chloroflexota bacterium]